MTESPKRPNERTWSHEAMGDRSGVRTLSVWTAADPHSPLYELGDREDGAVLARIQRAKIEFDEGETARVRRRFGRVRLVVPEGRVLVEAVPRRGRVWTEAGEVAELVLSHGSAGSRTWRRAEVRREATAAVAVEIVYTHEVGAWDRRLLGLPRDGARREHSARFDGSVAHTEAAQTPLVAMTVLLALGWRWTVVNVREGSWTGTHQRIRSAGGP